MQSNGYWSLPSGLIKIIMSWTLFYNFCIHLYTHKVYTVLIKLSSDNISNITKVNDNRDVWPLGPTLDLFRSLTLGLTLDLFRSLSPDSRLPSSFLMTRVPIIKAYLWPCSCRCSTKGYWQSIQEFINTKCQWI